MVGTKNSCYVTKIKHIMLPFCELNHTHTHTHGEKEEGKAKNGRRERERGGGERTWEGVTEMGGGREPK